DKSSASADDILQRYRPTLGSCVLQGARPDASPPPPGRTPPEGGGTRSHPGSGACRTSPESRRATPRSQGGGAAELAELGQAERIAHARGEDLEDGAAPLDIERRDEPLRLPGLDDLHAVEHPEERPRHVEGDPCSAARPSVGCPSHT